MLGTQLHAWLAGSSSHTVGCSWLRRQRAWLVLCRLPLPHGHHKLLPQRQWVNGFHGPLISICPSRAFMHAHGGAPIALISRRLLHHCGRCWRALYHSPLHQLRISMCMSSTHPLRVLCCRQTGEASRDGQSSFRCICAWPAFISSHVSSQSARA